MCVITVTMNKTQRMVSSLPEAYPKFKEYIWKEQRHKAIRSHFHIFLFQRVHRFYVLRHKVESALGIRERGGGTGKRWINSGGLLWDVWSVRQCSKETRRGVNRLLTRLEDSGMRKIDQQWYVVLVGIPGVKIQEISVSRVIVDIVENITIYEGN